MSEKFQTWTAFEPMTFAELLQCSTNWAIKSTGSWSFCKIDPWKIHNFFKSLICSSDKFNIFTVIYSLLGRIHVSTFRKIRICSLLSNTITLKRIHAYKNAWKKQDFTDIYKLIPRTNSSTSQDDGSVQGLLRIVQTNVFWSATNLWIEPHGYFWAKKGYCFDF